MKKIVDCFVVQEFVISSQKLSIKGVHLIHFKKNCLIESVFFSYEERYTYE